MRGRSLLVLLAALVALSGCNDDGAGAAGGDGSDGSDGDASDGADTTSQENGTGGMFVQPEDPLEETWYFTADGGLQNETPAAGSVNVAISATAFLIGFEVYEFLSPPLERAMWIHPDAIALTLYLASDGPMVSNGLFDMAVWGGSTKAVPLFSFTTHDPVHAPGAPVEMTLELDFAGQRAIFVPAGESVRFLVGSNFLASQESGLQEMLVGGDTASGFTMTRQYVDDDPLLGAEEVPHDAYTGQVTQLFAPTDCDTLPGTTSVEIAIPVGEDAIGISGQLAATNSVGDVKDLDMDLYDGGTRIASGHTPYDDERFFLVGEAFAGLAGKELTAKVGTCGQGPIDFQLDVTEWKAPTLLATVTEVG